MSETVNQSHKQTENMKAFSPRSSMASRFLMGMVSGAGSVVIKHLLNIMLLPLLIATLGLDLFGLYMLLVGIQEICLFLDMGFSNALVLMLSDQQDTSITGETNAIAQAERQQQRQEILKVGHTFFQLLGLMILVILAVLYPIFPIVFHIDAQLVPMAQLCLIMVLLEASLTMYTTYYRGFLFSQCMHQWNNIGDTLFQLIGVVGGVGLLLLGFGLPGLLAARVLGSIVRAALVIFYSLRQEALVCNPQAKFSISQMQAMLRLTFHAMMINMSVIISHKMDTVVVGCFLPLSAVSVYELVFRLLGSIMQLVIKLSEGTFPLFATFLGGDNISHARKLFLRMSCFNHFMAGSLLVLVLSFYTDLFHFFSAGRVPIEKTIPILLIITPVIWSSALQLPASNFLYGAGQQKFLTISSLVAAFANLILSLLLVKPLGLAGVALGTLIPQLIQHQFSLIRKSCQLLNISLKEYLMAVYAKVVIILAIYGGSIFLLKQSAFAQWLSVTLHPLADFLLIGGGMLSFAAVAWVLWTATRHEKELLVLKLVTPIRQKLSKRLLPAHTLEISIAEASLANESISAVTSVS